MKRILRRLPAFILFFVILQSLGAEFFSDGAGSFALDLPEGFTLAASMGNGASYLLKSAILPVELIVRVFAADQNRGARAAMESVCARLGAQAEPGDFTWQGRDCAISRVVMRPAGYTAPQAGWAVASPLPDTGGAIVCLAYTPAPLIRQTEQFVLAVLDSLMVDEDSFLSPGPVTAFVFPGKEEKTVTLTIGGRSITAPLNKGDSEAAASVIDREFSVLTLYGASPLRDKAWQRYYRQIYRDSYARVHGAAEAIAAALGGESRRKSQHEYLLRTLLAWTQGFAYGRNVNASDFESLPSILEGGASDCDSRSMLLAAILNAAGCRAVMFFSPEYKHAVLGAEVNLRGAKINLDGRAYLLGETTAKVEPGLIPKDMTDTDKWIPVVFP
ncbi:MAG: hypothetical protein LBR23_00485 [Spirochaetaceae bacterium]|jgi:hypothetical protein|nr:hypothetical protein [Spirochaetaceae bacterium]